MKLTVKFNQEDNGLFPKQYKRFKQFLKQLMGRLRKGDIDNFSYKEDMVDDVLTGTFTINDPLLDIPDIRSPVFFSN